MLRAMQIPTTLALRSADLVWVIYLLRYPENF